MCIDSLLNRRYLQVSGSVSVRRGVVGRLGLGLVLGLGLALGLQLGIGLLCGISSLPSDPASRDVNFVFFSKNRFSF